MSEKRFDSKSVARKMVILATLLGREGKPMPDDVLLPGFDIKKAVREAIERQMERTPEQQNVDSWWIDEAERVAPTEQTTVPDALRPGHVGPIPGARGTDEHGRLTDADINSITMDRLGLWPTFQAQAWACKVTHTVVDAYLGLYTSSDRWQAVVEPPKECTLTMPHGKGGVRTEKLKVHVETRVPVPEYLLARLKMHAEDTRNSANARSSMIEVLQYIEEDGKPNMYTDEKGTVWDQPTAWAYAQVCKARSKWQAKAEALASPTPPAGEGQEPVVWLREFTCGDHVDRHVFLADSIPDPRKSDAWNEGVKWTPLTHPSPQAAQHSDDAAVERFAAAMKAKLAAKRKQGRGGWENKDDCDNGYLSDLLRKHVNKGDPLDVGNLAMMLHQRGERIAQDAAKPAQDEPTWAFDAWAKQYAAQHPDLDLMQYDVMAFASAAYRAALSTPPMEGDALDALKSARRALVAISRTGRMNIGAEQDYNSAHVAKIVEGLDAAIAAMGGAVGVASVNPTDDKPASVKPTADECCATGEGHTYTDNGPHGESQCEFCGEPQPIQHLQRVVDLRQFGQLSTRELNSGMAVLNGELPRAKYYDEGRQHEANERDAIERSMSSQIEALDKVLASNSKQITKLKRQRRNWQSSADILYAYVLADDRLTDARNGSRTHTLEVLERLRNTRDRAREAVVELLKRGIGRS